MKSENSFSDARVGDVDTKITAAANNNHSGDNDSEYGVETYLMKRHLSRKLDLRLCTIAGVLCSLNLLDSGIISSASVTSYVSLNSLS